ncbi:hypothetical protein BU198_14175 [Streptomyces sp. CBMA156]|nr:hypothetical protein [Streptomyces sp. CBMA156]
MQFWDRIRSGFHAADAAERWTARAAWAMATASVWLVLVFTVVWGVQVAGAPPRMVAALLVFSAFAVPVVSAVAVTAAPHGHTRRPVLMAAVLLTAVACALAVAAR